MGWKGLRLQISAKIGQNNARGLTCCYPSNPALPVSDVTVVCAECALVHFGRAASAVRVAEMRLWAHAVECARINRHASFYWVPEVVGSREGMS